MHHRSRSRSDQSTPIHIRIIRGVINWQFLAALAGLVMVVHLVVTGLVAQREMSQKSRRIDDLIRITERSQKQTIKARENADAERESLLDRQRTISDQLDQVLVELRRLENQ